MLLIGIGAYLGDNIKLNGPVLTSALICLTPVYAAVQATLAAPAWGPGTVDVHPTIDDL